MLLQKKPKSMFSIRALVVAALAFGTWFHPLDAYGMGPNERIDGLLESTAFNYAVGKCVREGRLRTGLGVEAISYAGVHLQCDMFSRVDDLLVDPNWCSTWVLPNSPNECRVGDGGGSTGAKRCPILLDLDRNEFHISGEPVDFDLDSDGQRESVTWVSPGTRDAFLYLDLNGNGLVDDGSELFGDGTLLTSGVLAEHGYQALAEFDLVENGGNQDGVIDDTDSIFSDLKVWVDSNANGVHEHLESQSLAEAGVLSLGLDYRESPRTDRHGNEFRYFGRGMIEVNGRAERMRTTDVFFRVLGE